MFFDLLYLEELKAIEFSLNTLKNTKVIVCKHFEKAKELLDLKEKLRKEFDSKVFVCQLIENMKEIPLFKGKADFLAIEGGTQKANTLALNKNVNLVLNPVKEAKLEVDVGLLRNYALQEKIILTSFSLFNEKKDFEKALMLKNLFLLGKLARKTKTLIVTVSGAKTFNELKSAKDLLAFSSLYLKEPKELAEKAFNNLFEEKKEVKVID